MHFHAGSIRHHQQSEACSIEVDTMLGEKSSENLREGFGEWLTVI
jgi:hypothetical protein